MPMISVPFGDTTVQRIAPLHPVSAYRTYGLSMPLKTHWRRATCAEVSCLQYLNGWVSTFDLSTDLGAKQYHFCSREDRDRSFTEERTALNLVRLSYPAGTPCFRRGQHQVPLERPARLIVAHGDWRGFLGAPRVHARAQDWVEDFSLHADKINTAIGRG